VSKPCGQHEKGQQCTREATHRYYWPGMGWCLICEVHLPWMKQIAETLGLGDPTEKLEVTGEKE